jgi:phosphatidylglycerophosphatase C
MNLRALESTPAVALFDLDGTLTWRDTLLPFLTGYLLRHPMRLPRLWRFAFGLVEYAARDRDRGRLKSSAIRAVMGGLDRAQVDTYAELFMLALEAHRMFRATALATLAAHRAAGDHCVLLSASPDLYVPRIGRLLGFERTICTELRWNGERLDGGLKTENRHGEEKLRCLEFLRSEYPDASIIAYGNSSADLAHMRRADRAVLVNGSAAARRSAADAGIAIADWT